MTCGRTLASLALTVAAVACSSQGDAPSVLQSQDLTTSQTFDKNEIVPTAAFIDATGVDIAEVTQFLRRTPYVHASFLATYESNGVTAMDAIANAAATYTLNPLVFLVRAEMEQGLVGDQGYPSPPRVEFAFGCGCSASGCDMEFSGFDRQVQCLAADLRASLDAIAANKVTPSGWGPGRTNSTLDNPAIAVTPKDEATAALYEYLPIVAEGHGGNWLFWNIWQLYADALQYQPPATSSTGMPTEGAPAGVGDACESDATCSYPGGYCGTGASYPGGLCLQNCAGDCPFSRSACIDLGKGVTSVCLRVCDPVAPSCRSGYSCSPKQELNTGAMLNVCF